MLTLRFLKCGAIRFDPAVFNPELARGTKVEGPIFCWLLERDGERVLVDTGCHPQVAEDPEAAWGGLVKAFYPLVSGNDLVTEVLRRIDVDPASIGTVVCTHLHMDHCGCNSRFPQARFLVHEAEWNAVQDPGLEGQGYFRRDWDHPLDYITIQDNHDIFGDGSAVVRHLPGHTPGSVAVVLELAARGRVVLAADASPLLANVGGVVPRNTWNREQSQRSLEQLRAWQREGATIICGHDPEQGVSLPPAEAAWE